MRVTEQIDALDIMGVNSANLLILPKIIASVIFNPLLIAISIVFGIWGGYSRNWNRKLVCCRLHYRHTNVHANAFYMVCVFKTAVFAFLIATIPAYFGYNVSGGSLEVGRASTQAVVWTIVAVIITNLILTQMFLS
jgi:phospholipid/cholesterol/gamma-HCH transport system permease protein